VSIPTVFPPWFLTNYINRHRIRQQVKQTPDNATARQSSTLTEQRNILRNRLRAWEEILPIYMPGLLQYRKSLESNASSLPQSNSTPSTDHPEDAVIWLPSHIPASLRSRVCYAGLADIEDRIRTAQCNDNLDAVRHVLKIKARMVHFKNSNVRGQRDGTRSRTVIDRVHERARVAAGRYRAARRAKLALLGPGDWEESLRVLNDGDIRSYQDPDRLRVRTGHRGILEDGQLAADVQEDTVMDDDRDVAPETLYQDVRERRDGTGETRRTLSWIWTTKSRAPNPDDETDNILRVEWAKSRARAARCQEEVLLLKEEMRRVIAFLGWKAEWWIARRTGRTDVTNKELLEGLQAYAEVQADLQKTLKEDFCAIWKLPLNDTSAPDDDSEDDEDDDSGEDDDNEDSDNEETLDEDLHNCQ